MNLPRQGLWMFAATMVLLVVGCTRLEMAELPPDPALPASEAAFWNDIADVESGDWFYLLNTGDEALEWRLRMIDSARVSIDMETFLWKPDESGRQIVAHVLAAADRGVKVQSSWRWRNTWTWKRSTNAAARSRAKRSVWRGSRRSCRTVRAGSVRSRWPVTFRSRGRGIRSAGGFFSQMCGR